MSDDNENLSGVSSTPPPYVQSWEDDCMFVRWLIYLKIEGQWAYNRNTCFKKNCQKDEKENSLKFDEIKWPVFQSLVPDYNNNILGG